MQRMLHIVVCLFQQAAAVLHPHVLYSRHVSQCCTVAHQHFAAEHQPQCKARPAWHLGALLSVKLCTGLCVAFQVSNKCAAPRMDTTQPQAHLGHRWHPRVVRCGITMLEAFGICRCGGC